MDNHAAVEYLQAILEKRLRLHTTDTRIFVGEFKCTDNERNVILSQAYEYRPPSYNEADVAAPLSLTVANTSRFLGLIVVPGQHITKIEVEDPPTNSISEDTS
ncbi:hypothetical protein MMC12_001439 [Toensbergia leucococca]|nr:hypothetical protein [Toensbergia leucococca]